MRDELGINLEAVHCPQCSARMPPLRVPADLHQLMWGGWTCPSCGTRMDKYGRRVDADRQA
ncbi:hypothetical protein [Xanthomonas sp. XNM01]|uniref:hypothetical protein n=1 Tax=Xanthomonas sp. XNM01 TaxID=2769289 RepID=UPI00177E1B87|nr:hypothetical protein [Xanthomonas sp. XNM01]MBD9370825.1 hypothetical protein [Xanthomonas sp. XNM01]